VTAIPRGSECGRNIFLKTFKEIILTKINDVYNKIKGIKYTEATID